jgi:NAD(P)-dependent dehydrogenase (short-subunit alcohol dehydrogenase family)
LLLHTRSSVAALDEVSASCSESGATVETALADIAEVGGAKSLVDACIAKFGRLDCVVVSSANPPKQHALTSPAASPGPACLCACLPICHQANAGHADSTPFEEIDMAGFQLMFATMAQSFLELTQAALPLLKQSAAPRVVAISSFIAHRYDEGSLFVSSAAAKAALESVVRTLARVGAPDRIPVNIVVRPA